FYTLVRRVVARLRARLHTPELHMIEAADAAEECALAIVQTPEPAARSCLAGPVVFIERRIRSARHAVFGSRAASNALRWLLPSPAARAARARRARGRHPTTHARRAGVGHSTPRTGRAGFRRPARAYRRVLAAVSARAPVRRAAATTGGERDE